MTKYEMILSVYHTHSISVTAEKYNYTQSAISQAIKSFEKELGLPLLKERKMACCNLKYRRNYPGIANNLRCREPYCGYRIESDQSEKWLYTYRNDQEYCI